MVFFALPSQFPEMEIWGALRDNLTFVITVKNNGEIRASVKMIGAKKFDGTRIDLGLFDTLQAAQQACKEFRS